MIRQQRTGGSPEYPFTDEDRAWLDRHSALASGSGDGLDRHYLACGHQVGGPFDDLAARDCETCGRYLFTQATGLPAAAWEA